MGRSQRLKIHQSIFVLPLAMPYCRTYTRATRSGRQSQTEAERANIMTNTTTVREEIYRLKAKIRANRVVTEGSYRDAVRVNYLLTQPRNAVITVPAESDH